MMIFIKDENIILKFRTHSPIRSLVCLYDIIYLLTLQWLFKVGIINTQLAIIHEINGISMLFRIWNTFVILEKGKKKNVVCLWHCLRTLILLYTENKKSEFFVDPSISTTLLFIFMFAGHTFILFNAWPRDKCVWLKWQLLGT